MALNGHPAALQRVATHNALLLDDSARAGQAKISLQVRFRRCPSGQTLHSRHDFNDAFLAFALFSAEMAALTPIVSA